jgi:hypothetical protein
MLPVLPWYLPAYATLITKEAITKSAIIKGRR